MMSNTCTFTDKFTARVAGHFGGSRGGAQVGLSAEAHVLHIVRTRRGGAARLLSALRSPREARASRSLRVPNLSLHMRTVLHCTGVRDGRDAGGGGARGARRSAPAVRPRRGDADRRARVPRPLAAHCHVRPPASPLLSGPIHS